MPNRQTITINLWDPVQELTYYCGVEVEPLRGDLYRVAEIPLPIFGPKDLEYGDVVELVFVSGNTYEVRGVRERGGWRRFNFLIQPDSVDSEALQNVLLRVEAAGGRSVRDFGGCFSIVMPPDSTWDPSQAISGNNTP